MRQRCSGSLAAAMAIAIGTAAPGAARDATPVPTAMNDMTAAPSGPAILARVKAGLRAIERPPYVVYTLVRRDTIDGLPDFGDSYTLRIWCRTSDNAAVSRHVWASRASGPAEYIVPAFNEPIDPGPPTADLLDVIRQTQGSATPPPSANAPHVIGSVSVVIETHYHVTFAGIDGNDDHLVLEARRDPERNRLTDLYVDRQTYVLHRAVAHDRLYSDGQQIPLRFEIDFGALGGVPIITKIHAQTDDSASAGRNTGVPRHEVDYRFEGVAFPAELPAWYFEPSQYGAHRAEFPT